MNKSRKEYYQRNKERIKAYQRDYFERNKEAKREYAREYSRQNSTHRIFNECQKIMDACE